MARTATKENEEKAAQSESVTPGIRHVLRVLGPMTMPELNITSYEDTERHLQVNYFEDGWKLKDTLVLNVNKGREIGAGLGWDPVTVLYILVKPDVIA